MQSKLWPWHTKLKSFNSFKWHFIYHPLGITANDLHRWKWAVYYFKKDKRDKFIYFRQVTFWSWVFKITGFHYSSWKLERARKRSPYNKSNSQSLGTEGYAV